MVTYRTGTGRRLYMITSADARQGTVYLYIKFAIIPPKKQVAKIRKTEADPDSDEDENHTCSRLQKFQEHLFVAYYSSPAAQAKYIFQYL